MKISIVTGGSRGIGLGITKALLSNGDTVVLCGVKPLEAVTELMSELNSAYDNRAHYIKCDISLEEDRKNIIKTVSEKFGRIDTLVNNAGVACDVRLDVLETTTQSFERLMRINLEGTFFMCQEGANEMIKLKKSVEDENYIPRIINLSSISAYTSSTSRGEYCISKAGIAMVTSLFADRLAEEGIPVFEVRPGIIMTDMTAGVTEKYEKLIAEGVTPIKRFGMPEDVANCVLALSKGYMDFGTGTVINADGGFHIRRL